MRHVTLDILAIDFPRSTHRHQLNQQCPLLYSYYLRVIASLDYAMNGAMLLNFICLPTSPPIWRAKIEIHR
jgi:hypothetical protein